MPAVIRKFRRLANDEGSSIVETAVASTVFLAMLIGCFQAMLSVYVFNFVSDAAREGSRYAVVRGSASCSNTPNLTNCNATASQIQTYVQGLKYPGINSSNLTVTTSWLTAGAGTPATWSACTTGTCNAPGNLVKVKATYAYTLSVPFTKKWNLNLSSTSQMVISQ